MKKILGILLVLVMSLQFVGCAPSKEDLNLDAKLLSTCITNASWIGVSCNIGDEKTTISDVEKALEDVKELKNEIDNTDWLTEKYEDVGAKFSSGLDKWIQALEKAKVAMTDGPYYDLMKESLEINIEYLEIAQECAEECAVDITEGEE